MDFKFIKMKKKGEDNTEDHGKLNFYIVNRRYKFMNEFFISDMFKNMLIIFTLDLDKPEKIEESFYQWKEFIYNSIRMVIDGVDITRKKIII